MNNKPRRSELGLKLDGLEMSKWFTPQQWEECGQLVKHIRCWENEVSGQGQFNFPRLTYEVLAAFRSCPRHFFCHPQYAHEAYQDRARPISCDQVISQPSLVCMMTSSLEVKKGDKVLEIGTGSGYQAAILATMGVEVYTIEIYDQLYEESAPKLKKYAPDLVKVARGDGFHGWPDAAPFDGIVVTCGIDKVPPTFVEQIKMGKHIIIPIDVPGPNRGHMLYDYQKTPNGMTKREVSGCCFVPFIREE